MKKIFLFFLFSLVISNVARSGEESAESADTRVVRKVSCRALRDEPGAPAYAFELVRKANRSYEARYLFIPGNESSPPEVMAAIGNLKCKFLSSNGFYFQCLRFGASVESIRIREQKRSLIADQIQTDYFREFRSIGVDVPGGYLVYRFASADICSVRY